MLDTLPSVGLPTWWSEHSWHEIGTYRNWDECAVEICILEICGWGRLEIEGQRAIWTQYLIRPLSKLIRRPGTRASLGKRRLRRFQRSKWKTERPCRVPMLEVRAICGWDGMKLRQSLTNGSRRRYEFKSVGLGISRMKNGVQQKSVRKDSENERDRNTEYCLLVTGMEMTKVWECQGLHWHMDYTIMQEKELCNGLEGEGGCNPCLFCVGNGYVPYACEGWNGDCPQQYHTYVIQEGAQSGKQVSFSYGCSLGLWEGLASGFPAGKDDAVDKQVKIDVWVIESWWKQDEAKQPTDDQGSADWAMDDDEGSSEDLCTGGWKWGLQIAIFPKD